MTGLTEERKTTVASTCGTSVPVEVTVLSDSPVVRLGVQAMLRPYPGRVRTSAHPWQTGERTPTGSVVLADAGPRLTRAIALATRPGGDPVLVYGRDLHSGEVRRALAAGCAGHVDLRTSAADLLLAIESVRDSPSTAYPRWAGREHGLSRREAEALALVCEGLTNHDIAERMDLTTNTVKSYIRTAYRKVGVSRRPEAVRWGVEHGLLAAPDTTVRGR